MPSKSETSSLSGFCTRVRFCRIAPVTWANDAPLETVANRWAPMACGPNVDQVAGKLSVPAHTMLQERGLLHDR